MGFSRQEYWSGLPFPSPGGLPKPGIEPWSPTLEADALIFEPPGKPKDILELINSSGGGHLDFQLSWTVYATLNILAQAYQGKDVSH